MDERPAKNADPGPLVAGIHAPEVVKRPIDDEAGWYDIVPGYLMGVIQRRNNAGSNFVIAVTGPPGKRKSTWGGFWAEKHEREANNHVWDPLHQFAFNPKMFKEACDYCETLDDGLWHDIVVDDPSGEYSADQWMTPMARIMTSYLQTTSRRERRNVWFPVPNLELIPKGARRITIYEAMMKEEHPGVSRCHKLKWNKYGHTPEVFKKFFLFADSKRPKAWPVMEEMAKAWRRGFYTIEKFEGKKTVEKEITLTDQTYGLVTADRDYFRDPDRGKITAARIIGGVFNKQKLKISRKVADEVLARLQDFSRPSRPGSSAPVDHSDTDSDPETRPEAP